MSSTVASFGTLTVLLMAPEMNGCTALCQGVAQGGA